MSIELLPLERAAIVALLTGDHPVLETLRHQLDTARVERRDMTGVGFFTYITTSPTTQAVPNVPARVVIAQGTGKLRDLRNGIGFILWLESGRLNLLEGYTFDEPWPEEPGDMIVTQIDPVEKRLGWLMDSTR